VGKRTKAEGRALAEARRAYPDATILEQGTVFRFPDGGRYTCDLTIYAGDCSPIHVEVKGGYRGPGWEQGVERYKRAKATWPNLRFELWDMSTKGGAR
jgi:hypothetical protein